MCGICGILATSSEFNGHDRKIIEAMKDRMAHRGPDGEGTHVSDFGILGHRRLAIIDLEHGNQPMLSPDERYALVFNGEIYNYLELRQHLTQQGCKFSTFSDTEVLLQMLLREGSDGLNKLNGMFAFLFLDTHTGRWLMARDQFGVKPLYFTQTSRGKILFASEIKAILAHPEVEARPNGVGLGHYFTFQFCLAEETLFEGIKKLEPGHFLKGRGGKIEKKVCYWDTDFTVDEHHTEEYFSEKLRSLLEDSARLQVRSDVPIGSYLSGGLDSSVIASFASECLSCKLPVFTGKFNESPAYDESGFARDMADSIGGIMHDIAPTSDDFVHFLQEMSWIMDEPLAGPGVFPQFMVSSLASQHVKVILGGQGGDEIFGGYARYLVGYLEQALKGAIYETQEEGKYLVGLDSIIPNLPILKQYIPLMKNFLRDGLFEAMDARYFRLIDRSPYLVDMLTPETVQNLDQEQVFNDFKKLFNHPDTQSYINKMTHFDFKTLLPALLHVEDRVSMAVSLESRVPLLDTRIIELVASVPPTMKFKGGKTKALLKSAVRNKLPDSIINRKDKMGFPVPIKEWMRKGPVREFVGDTLLSQRSLQRNIYKPEALQNMMSDQGVGGRQLWGALSLELWHQRFIDG